MYTLNCCWWNRAAFPQVRWKRWLNSISKSSLGRPFPSYSLCLNRLPSFLFQSSYNTCAHTILYIMESIIFISNRKSVVFTSTVYNSQCSEKPHFFRGTQLFFFCFFKCFSVCDTLGLLSFWPHALVAFPHFLAYSCWAYMTGKRMTNNWHQTIWIRNAMKRLLCMLYAIYFCVCCSFEECRELINCAGRTQTNP